MLHPKSAEARAIDAPANGAIQSLNDEGGASRNMKAQGSNALPCRPKRKPLRWTLDGFLGETTIRTDRGITRLKDLTRNDKVRIRSGDFAKIDHIDNIKLDEDFLMRHPQAFPIRIRAGALGPGLPDRDLEVSPCQVIFSDRTAAGGERTAESLLSIPGVYRSPKTGITYTRLSLVRPACVKVANLWAQIPG